MYLPTVGLCLFWIAHSAAATVDLECMLLEVDVRTATDSSVPSHACIYNHISYDVSLSGYSGAVTLGRNVVLTKVTVNSLNSQVTLSKQSTIEAKNRRNLRRRNLGITTGLSKVLVVRVQYRGRSPQLTSQDLAGRIFGRGNRQVGLSVAEQFLACSFGKFVIEPFQAAGVENGVAQVSINTAVSGSNSALTLQNLVINQAKASWPIDQIDHVILVMPDAGLRYFDAPLIAYAFLDGAVSVYNNLWAGRLSAVMHEVGHNLGLHHSGQGGNDYGDQSGYMVGAVA
jgi:Gametolysin peptidase M11